MRMPIPVHKPPRVLDHAEDGADQHEEDAEIQAAEAGRRGAAEEEVEGRGKG
jgi:hypothetical protein